MVDRWVAQSHPKATLSGEEHPERGYARYQLPRTHLPPDDVRGSWQFILQPTCRQNALEVRQLIRPCDWYSSGTSIAERLTRTAS